MARPSEYPDWATTDVVDGTSGQNNVVAPSGAKILTGWNRREKPPRQWFNWMGRLTGQWIRQIVTELDSLFGRTIKAGTGLTGGGDLSADRTLSVDFAVVRSAVLLNETSFTAVASVDLATVFSDNPGYSYYMVEVDGAGTNQPDKDIILRVSVDGSTFRSTAGDYAVGGTFVQLGDNITTAFRLFAKVVFFAPESTTAVCPIAGQSVKTPLTATVAPTYLTIQDAFIATLDDVTGIQVRPEDGLLRAEGTLRVYGSNTPL